MMRRLTDSPVPVERDVFYREGPDGIRRPQVPIAHRSDEYEESSFEVLSQMQKRHFWYLGRHRFLLYALSDQIRREGLDVHDLRAVDLGGGCGGWIQYLRRSAPHLFTELALADSSLRALEVAGSTLGDGAARYQADVLNLGWKERWDVVFLLDVLEHLPQDRETLLEIREALVPGGLLFVTTPALQSFWTYNDEIAQHQRRYSRRDFQRLATSSGFELRRARYFMFLLSPLVLASRLKRPPLERMTHAEIHALVARTHRVPSGPLNLVLRTIFSLETPWGWWLSLPWGTSILGVFKKV